MRLMSVSLKWLVGLPVAGIALLTLVQLPKLWTLVGQRPDIFGLAVLQGGLPLLPYVFFAAALWFAADMIGRVRPDMPLEPVLIRGLRRAGTGLILGGMALGLKVSPWVWTEIYNNTGPQPPGTANYVLFALVAGLMGAVLIAVAGRIRHLQTARSALQSELEQYV
ncbi:hypothetical protein [Asticcacaulis sp. YBE204]|uniref:hypothetical protein n=1 Tax=Asticcacaulis sp. YBE204 TaxID=1282363 RepID=UPI0003C3D0B7|nr:hypothetical protein [Asticcacaulis sp. YBE204]ESQ81332.1 hypothetical protein AEYBE204_03040 [Asticcacaulis sp. YBE204]